MQKELAEKTLIIKDANLNLKLSKNNEQVMEK